MIADLPSNVAGRLKRPRFSLRALFLLTTLAAIVCTYVVLPTLTARRFRAAVANHEFTEADNFFRNPTDKFLAEWADKKWGFKASADVAPWSLGQMFRGQREVVVRVGYFEFDQNASCTATIGASSLGLGSPTVSPVSHGGRYIDEARGALRPEQTPIPTR
jgi:hypothetical protein